MKLGILCGGKSAEHDISLRSANNIYKALLDSDIEPVLIGVTREGKWVYRSDDQLLQASNRPNQPILNEEVIEVVLPPASGGQLWELGGKPLPFRLDAIFPILHGPLGEDGAVQGLLKIADVPFVGPDVLGSAIGMDKDIMKKILREAGIAIGPYISVLQGQDLPSYEQVQQQLGMPVYIKPANMGSSVGITMVSQPEEWQGALDMAFEYDRKIVIEQNIVGRELECAVLGNVHPQASTIGEIEPVADFYSYEAKYLNDHDAKLNIPASIDNEIAQKIQKIAIDTFKVLQCEGLGRVDVFLQEDGQIIVNEINTLPGFTSISMYPQLWQHSGISYADLIQQLVELAIERHQRN